MFWGKFGFPPNPVPPGQAAVLVERMMESVGRELGVAVVGSGQR
jgi:hypothetical protein